MDGTIITFVVPAYNSAYTIRSCLDSLLDMDLLPYMEILVVNDGSTDDTACIVKEYASFYPSIRLTTKENGGHGSVINLAATIAKGKYFKVIDSDDSVQTNNLRLFVENLHKTNADAVFTNFRSINSQNGSIREYSMSNIVFGHECTFESFWQNSKNVKKVCNLPGITYNTEFYRRCNINLSERISYEDQEYVTLPFAYVETVLPLDMYLYAYNLGNTYQSMSDTNQVTRYGQMESVLWKLIDFCPKTPTAKSYFLYKKNRKLLSCYTVLLIKNSNKTEGRKLAKLLRLRVKQKDTGLHKASSMNYHLCYALSFFKCSNRIISCLQQFRFYGFLARWLR